MRSQSARSKRNHFKSALMHLHHGRQCSWPAAAFNRHGDLLGCWMHDHVVDDDLVVRRAENRGKLLICTANKITAFEVVKVAEFDAVLRRQIGVSQRKGMHACAGDVVDKQDVVRAKREHSGRMDPTGGASRTCYSAGGYSRASGESKSDRGDRAKSEPAPLV